MLQLYMNYDKEFISNNLMGPNVIKIAEELSQHLKFNEGMHYHQFFLRRNLVLLFMQLICGFRLPKILRE